MSRGIYAKLRDLRVRDNLSCILDFLCSLLFRPELTPRDQLFVMKPVLQNRRVVFWTRFHSCVLSIMDPQ